MKELIPNVVIAVVAEILADRETHATLNRLFLYSGAPDIAIEGSKSVKALEWLRAVNNQAEDPLAVLGKLIELYMEEDLGDDITTCIFSGQTTIGKKINDREKLSNSLARAGLYYHRGGVISKSTGVATKSLEQLIEARDFKSVDLEFERAMENISSSPREAVSAASNILESICKVYIAEEHLTLPARQDLRSVWEVVRKDLNFDPSQLEDTDLKNILTGLFRIVDGISAIRTRASSAHGGGPKVYNLRAKHARLAVHAAHTVGSFIFESWDEKRAQK